MILQPSLGLRRPQRVLHAYNQHRGGGGADNAARATIEATRRLGIEVDVYTRSSEDLPRTLAGRLEAGTSAIYSSRSVREFRARLDRFRPDVVHLHEVFPLVTPWILPECRKRGVPVVMTCVDYRLTCPIVTHLYQGELCSKCTGGNEHWALLRNCRKNITESITVTIYNAMSRQLGLFTGYVDRFLAPSEFTRRWLIAKGGLSADRVTTICPIVDIPERPSDPAQGGYVAFAGRLTPEKGLDVLIRAARRCPVPFWLSRDAAAFATVPIPDSMQVVVTKSRAELDAFYRGAKMLVFPSIWYETFGLVGAEAMAHGVPVVASRLGALESLVDDGVNGLLFERDNEVDLAERIMRLWNDPELARRLGASARQKAAAEWSEASHMKHLLQVYHELQP